MENKPRVGDVITIASPHLRPKYLNGAKIKVESEVRGQFEGTVVELASRPRNGAFRVGRKARGIPAHLIVDVQWKEHLEGQYAA